MAELIATISDSSAPINTVVFSPDGSSLAAGGNDSTLRVYSTKTGNVASFSEPDQHVTKAAFSPDSGQIVFAHHAEQYNTGGVYLVSGGPNGSTQPLSGHNGLVSWADFSPDGASIASSALDLTARIWDVATGTQTQVLVGHTVQPAYVATGVWCVRYAPSGNYLATSGSDGTVRLWDAASGKEQRVIQVTEGLVFAVAFSPDGDLLAASNEDGSIKIFDPATGKPLRTLAGHSGWVVGVEFSPDGSRIASAGYDGTARLWDAGSGASADVIVRGDKVHDVAFSPDGATLATGGDDGTVKQYAI